MQPISVIPPAQWLGLKENEPLIIAGPCSAETEAQVLATAHMLAKDKRVKAFRAGVWKPRTRPNSFEGVGLESLSWLQKVKQETGLPVATEIANAQHAEACLKAGIDILWIGARSTVNPFLVQEIADALQGTDVPVLIKNPINPDIELWIGAVERLQNAGLHKLVAVHRGFSSPIKGRYRNPPEWHIAIEMMRRIPGLPMICDPSHICGNTHLLLHVAQTAFDMKMDGLIIETHPNPKEAWSDAKQQVTPAELWDIFDSLVLRNSTINTEEFLNHLTALRRQIDLIDDRIIETFAERMDLVRQVGEYKRDHNVSILQIARWAEILEQRQRQGKRIGLPEHLVEDLFNLIHNSSISLQESIFRAAEVGK